MKNTRYRWVSEHAKGLIALIASAVFAAVVLLAPGQSADAATSAQIYLTPVVTTANTAVVSDVFTANWVPVTAVVVVIAGIGLMSTIFNKVFGGLKRLRMPRF